MAKDKKNKRANLGKGIGALLSSFDTSPSQNPAEEPKDNLASRETNVIEIPLDKIEVNPHQPRKNFDDTSLQELADSIQLHGIIQPITVRSMGDGSYQLISGERRLRASKLAQIPSIPAYIRVADDKAMQEMALIENLQREDLSPMEVASTYKLLIDKYQLRQEDLAQRVGKSRVSITQVLSLLSLPPSIVDALNAGEISRGHAIVLAREEDPSLQLLLLKRILEEKLSVRALEKVLAAYKDQSSSSSNSLTKAKTLPLEYEKVQEDLKSYFGAKVKLSVKSNGKGQILIPFSSSKDLNRLLDLLEEQQ